MFITVEILRSHKACQDQVDLFAATFPDGVQVTEAVCLAAADKFDFRWAAENLLPPEARAEYQAKHASILGEYRAKRAPIWAEYRASNAAIWDAYGTKHAAIWAECKAKSAPILAEYEAKRAALFGRIAETLGD